MSGIADQFRSKGIGCRSFQQGEIYLAVDKEVKMPDEKIFGREFHDKRPVVILFDHLTNNQPTFPTVVAVPLSHNVTKKRDSDLFVPASDSGVKYDSLLRLGLIQPFLKIDLEGPVGELSEDVVDQMLALVLHMLGVDMEDSEAAVGIIFE